MNYDENKYPWLWKKTSTRGYCFTAEIPCRVLRIVGKKVEIAALLVGGTERVTLVKEENLKHYPCNCFAHCRGMEKYKKLV